MQDKPSFTIEKDKIGLGHCVIAQWQAGRREVITGFGTESDAQKWIDELRAGKVVGRIMLTN